MTVCRAEGLLRAPVFLVVTLTPPFSTGAIPTAYPTCVSAKSHRSSSPLGGLYLVVDETGVLIPQVSQLHTPLIVDFPNRPYRARVQVGKVEGVPGELVSTAMCPLNKVRIGVACQPKHSSSVYRRFGKFAMNSLTRNLPDEVGRDVGRHLDGWGRIETGTRKNRRCRRQQVQISISNLYFWAIVGCPTACIFVPSGPHLG